MEIYIKIEPLKNSVFPPGWWVAEQDSDCGSYINSGDELVDPETGDLRGSAAKSWTQAKAWAEEAKNLAYFDGAGQVQTTFWTWRGDDLVKTSAS